MESLPTSPTQLNNQAGHVYSLCKILRPCTVLSLLCVADRRHNNIPSTCGEQASGCPSSAYQIGSSYQSVLYSVHRSIDCEVRIPNLLYTRSSVREGSRKKKRVTCIGDRRSQYIHAFFPFFFSLGPTHANIATAALDATLRWKSTPSHSHFSTF
jgi:hypothetical protein